jgi:hypothetical protein
LNDENREHFVIRVEPTVVINFTEACVGGGGRRREGEREREREVFGNPDHTVHKDAAFILVASRGDLLSNQLLNILCPDIVPQWHRL